MSAEYWHIPQRNIGKAKNRETEFLAIDQVVPVNLSQHLKRKDEAAHGEYRTKRVIPEIYDEMAEAMRTGEQYSTRLDPPQADVSVAHPGTRLEEDAANA